MPTDAVAPAVSASSIGLDFDGGGVLLEEEIEEQQDRADELASAAFLGDLSGLQALVERGARVDQPDRNGYTALQLACTAGRADCARHLLAKGASVNAKGVGGSAPLHAAARNGHAAALRLLLSIPGVDVNALAKDGRTALHVAAQHDHDDAAQQLLEAGVDAQRKDRSGKTALDVACAAPGGAGSATARTLSAQENLGGLYRGRYRLTQRHERREHSMALAPGAPGSQVQARFGEDVTTGDSVALLFSEGRGDWERSYEVQTRLSVMAPPTPAQGMPPAMPSAGRVIDSFEDHTRSLPHCIVIDGWEETLTEYLDTRAGRLARNEAVYIAEGVLRSLHTIHAIGLVHTLVCPATIGRSWDGSWRLLDMYLLREPGEEAAAALLPPVQRLTYCPPELLAYWKATRDPSQTDGQSPREAESKDSEGAQNAAAAAAAAARDPATLCTAQVDLWMFGCVLCELMLGVPLIHVDAEELWQRPPKPKLHPWQVEEQAVEREARKVEEAAEHAKRQAVAARLMLEEDDDHNTGAVSMPQLPDTPEEPALYRLPSYLAPRGEAGLDRLSFELMNGLLGLPSSAPRFGRVEPSRLLPLEALQHKYFRGGVPRVMSSTEKARQRALDFAGEEDEEDVPETDANAVPAPRAEDQAVKDGRLKSVRGLDAKGNLETQVWRWSAEANRWETNKQVGKVMPAAPVPQPNLDGSPLAQPPNFNMAGSTAGTFGRGGAVDWIRRLRRDQKLPYPTMWAILPSDPNPRLEPGAAAAGEGEPGMQLGEGGSAEGASGLNPLPSRWAKLETWGRQSFTLHLMCEWEHGHFIHERYGYPIFKPRETLSRLAPLYQKLLTELSGPPDLLAECPHHIPYDKIRADLDVNKKDYRLRFRELDVETFMRSCCHQAFDPAAHTIGSPAWAMAKSNAREWNKARDATLNLSVDGEGSTNVALGKPVRVSSTHLDNDGSRAVNGSKDGWDNRWVSEKEDASPWIEVDLRAVFLIRAVSFWLSPVPISSYRIECRVGHGKWQELKTVEDNDELSALHDQFDITLADTVRLRAYERIKLYEIEVWGELYDIERGDVLRSLEWGQKFFAAVDPVAQYGNLYRCRLANGEHRWLCPYHAAHVKGDVELERPPPLRTVGELATERVLKIAAAAEAARKLGQEGARASGALALGVGERPPPPAETPAAEAAAEDGADAAGEAVGEAASDGAGVDDSGQAAESGSKTCSIS